MAGGRKGAKSGRGRGRPRKNDPQGATGSTASKANTGGTKSKGVKGKESRMTREQVPKSMEAMEGQKRKMTEIAMGILRESGSTSKKAVEKRAVKAPQGAAKASNSKPNTARKPRAQTSASRKRSRPPPTSNDDSIPAKRQRLAPDANQDPFGNDKIIWMRIARLEGAGSVTGGGSPESQLSNDESFYQETVSDWIYIGSPLKVNLSLGYKAYFMGYGLLHYLIRQSGMKLEIKEEVKPKTRSTDPTCVVYSLAPQEEFQRTKIFQPFSAIEIYVSEGMYPRYRFRLTNPDLIATRSVTFNVMKSSCERAFETVIMRCTSADGIEYDKEEFKRLIEEEKAKAGAREEVLPYGFVDYYKQYAQEASQS